MLHILSENLLRASLLGHGMWKMQGGRLNLFWNILIFSRNIVKSLMKCQQNKTGRKKDICSCKTLFPDNCLHFAKKDFFYVKTLESGSIVARNRNFVFLCNFLTDRRRELVSYHFALSSLRPACRPKTTPLSCNIAPTI